MNQMHPVFQQALAPFVRPVRHLRAAQRIATTSPNVSKHLIRSLFRMADDCDYERRRVME